MRHEGKPRSGSAAGPRHGKSRRRTGLLLLPTAFLAATGGLIAAFLLTRQHSPIANTASTVLPARTWFAPYVDVTAGSDYEFQASFLNPARQVVLGFVDAQSSACAPEWGGSRSLDSAATSLDLDRRIRQFQVSTGDVIVSFGGSRATDLADACHDPASLAGAYAKVIGRYHLHTVDIDVRGSQLLDTAAIRRSGLAIAALQRSMEAQRSSLAVWLTLPCEPSGMEADALAVVQSMLAAGVRLAGVDVLAMDFGTPSDPPADMGIAVEQALWAVHAQLEVVYRRAGEELTSRSAWAHLGATVMIGANDIPGETITLGDATSIVADAAREGLGRLSMLSLNRDLPCAQGSDRSSTAAGAIGASGASGASGTAASPPTATPPACTGVAAKTLAYAQIFARLPGTTGSTRPAPTVVPQLTSGSIPYPVWRHGETYHAGYKVVWTEDVYQAKWFTGLSMPGARVAHPWLTPWLLLGPVLPHEHPPTTTTLPPGTYPSWSPTAVYQKGHKVLYLGLPYIAAYWNKGVVPQPNPLDVSSAAWRPLFALPGEPRSSG